jgi:cell division septal protein FtsQ
MKRNILRKFKKIDFKLQPKFFFVLGVVVVASLAAAYSAGVLFSSNFFLVKDIKSNIALDPEIKQAVKGISLIKLDTQKLHRYVMKLHPEYKAVAITKELPSSVIIAVKKRIPFAQMKAQRFYPLDREAVVTGDGSPTAIEGLVVIDLADCRAYLMRGFHIKDDRLEIAMQILAELRKKKFLNKFPITLINATSQATLCVSLGTTNVILGADNYKYKLLVLENVIKMQLKGALDSVEYIDLRYKKAYVGFRR